MAGGAIDVDGRGLALGIFRENAVTAITSHISEAQEAIRRHYFKSALQKCLSGGLTMVQTNDSHAWDIYRDLQRQGLHRYWNKSHFVLFMANN